MAISARLPQEVAPFLREADALSAALEQQHAELVFELPDLPAQRRLRDVKQFGGATDVLGLGHCDEVPKLAQVKHR